MLADSRSRSPSGRLQMLAAMAVAYWLWPADLIPDATKFGRIDDVACALASCALAVRMSVRGAAR